MRTELIGDEIMKRLSSQRWLRTQALQVVLGRGANATPLSEEGLRPESIATQGQPSAASNNPEDSSESDSSGEDTAEDEDRKYEVLSSAPEIEKLAPQVEFGVDLDVYQNPRTLSLHGRAKGSTGPLICGRSVSGMKLFVGRVHSKTWRCKQCMAGRPIRDSGAAANFINSRLGSRQR